MSAHQKCFPNDYNGGLCRANLYSQQMFTCPHQYPFPFTLVVNQCNTTVYFWCLPTQIRVMYTLFTTKVSRKTISPSFGGQVQLYSSCSFCSWFATSLFEHKLDLNTNTTTQQHFSKGGVFCKINEKKGQTNTFCAARSHPGVKSSSFLPVNEKLREHPGVYSYFHFKTFTRVWGLLIG